LVVLPRRRVVERTFSWFGRNLRLARDFENLAETMAAFVTLASIELALRRLARATRLGLQNAISLLPAEIAYPRTRVHDNFPSSFKIAVFGEAADIPRATEQSF
jgi:hypothetical protein